MTALSAVAPAVAGASLLQWASVMGLGMVIAEVVRSWVQRRKMGADAAKTITDAASILIAPLQHRIKELEPLQQEVVVLRAAVSDNRRELESVHQLLSAAQKELVAAKTEAEEAKREVIQLKRRMTAAEAFQSQKDFLRPRDPDLP